MFFSGIEPVSTALIAISQYALIVSAIFLISFIARLASQLTIKSNAIFVLTLHGSITLALIVLYYTMTKVVDSVLDLP